MVRICLTILVGLLFTNQLFAQSSPSPGNDTFAFQPSGQVPEVTTTVTSKEVNSVDGTVQLDVTFNIPESVILKPNVTIYSQRPDTGGANYFTLNQNPLDSTIDSDTFSTQFTFSYDQNNLPYYAKELVIKGSYHEPGDTTSAGTFEANARLYFTPYNTLEVWNLKDFHSLERIWLHPQEGQNPQRQYIHPDSIPESTIITDTANIDHDWQKEWDYVFMEGLGYAIPMKKDQQPTCINEDACLQTKKGDGCFLSKRYKYRLQGNIEEVLRNDLGGWFSLPYSNLQVKFYENDLTKSTYTNIDDQYLGKTTLDEDGNFDFKFNICQQLEGGEIEVYIVVRAYNPKWKIRGRSVKTDLSKGNAPLFVNRAISHTIELSESEDRTVVNGIGVDLWSGLHSSTVYASHAMNFAENKLNQNHNDLQKPITIIRDFYTGDNSFFMPNSLLSGALPNPASLPTLGQTAIYLSDNAMGTENTTYHEMGHYLMWKLQDQNWIDPLTASFSEWGWIGEHNPRITWTEGWAEAFGFMCDLRYFQIDQECQWEDNTFNLERKRINRNRIINANFNNAFNIGFQNPASVAAAIYDLYDGQQTYNNQNIPTNPVNVGGRMVNFDFDDNGTPSWNNGNFGQDDVELTLQEICQPLIDNAGLSDKLHDIDDYFRALMRNASCTERRDIKRVFDVNEVVNDRNNPDETGLSSDMIGRNVTHDVDVINTNIFGIEVDWDYVEDFYIDNSTINSNTSDFNLASTQQNGYEVLTDDLTVTDDGTLFFNYNIPFEWTDEDNGKRPPQPSNTQINICGSELEVNYGGTLIVGDNVVNAHANVHVKNGAKVTLGDANGNAGNLRVNNNSKFVIEENASLVVTPGTNITLNGSKAELVIKGKLIIEDNATFTFSGGSAGSGFVTFASPTWPGSNVVYGQNSAFSLQGNGKQDVVMKVFQDNLYASNAANNSHTPEKFVVKDGKVLMEEGARILTNCPTLKFRKTHIVAENGKSDYDPAVSHRGIEIWPTDYDDNIDFSFSKIEDGSKGVYIHNTWTLARPAYDLKPITITDCKTGLQTNNGAFQFSGTLRDNHIGWLGKNMWAVSSLSGGMVKENTDAGIKFTGNNTGVLRIENSTIKRNVIGVLFSGNKVEAFCSDVTKNLSGFKIDGGQLVVSDKSTPMTGYVNMQDWNYSTPVELYPGRIQMHKGYNVLTERGEDLAGFRYFIPMIPNGSYPSLTKKANRNFWGLDNNWNPEKPDFGHNYDYVLSLAGFPVPLPNIPNFPVYSIPYDLQDNNILTTQQVPECPNPDDPPTDGGGWEHEVAVVTPDEGAPEIVSGEFAGTKLNKAVSTTIENMYNKSDGVDIPTAISQFHSILLNPIPSEQLTDKQISYANYNYDQAYEYMQEALAKGLSNGSINLDSSQMPPSLSKIIDVQNKILDTLNSQNVSDSAIYKQKFRVKIDKANVYMLNEDFSKAENTLNSLTGLAQTNHEQKRIDFWQCKSQYLSDLKNGNIELDTARYFAQNCQYPFRDTFEYSGNESGALPLYSKNQSNNGPSQNLRVYPNPTSGLVKIRFSTSSSKNVKIMLFDNKGRRLRTITNRRMTKGEVLAKSVDLRSYSSGKYYIKVNNGNKVLERALIKIQ